MLKKKILADRFLFSLISLSLVLLVVVSVVAAAPKNADASVAVDAAGCNAPCTLPGTISAAIVEVSTSIQAAIVAATIEIVSSIIATNSLNAGLITAKITDVNRAIIFGTAKLWYTKMQRALKKMTNQMMVMEADQARNLGSLYDAQDQERLRMEYQKQELISDRERRLGESVEVASTMVGGLGRAAAFKERFKNASSKERNPRSGGAIGVESSAGYNTDLNRKWKDYTTRYCKKDYNNGASGCEEDQEFADADVNVTNTLFSKETINLQDDNVKKSVDDLISNIAEPYVAELIPPSAIGSAEGQQKILEREAYKAKRQIIYDSLYYIVARRAPGSEMGEFVKSLREDSGIKGESISVNPSYNEIMHAMTTEKFRSGHYSLTQVDEPENNQRELVIQQAFMLMQMNDQMDLLDRQALLLSSQISQEIKNSKSSGSATEGAPIQ